mmetsp:Transcript_22513/g.62193  ORF Transcript_22513/g.62193 Transcript_22513/m.62193 type:complete len:100 (-) Transcript_22513:870-1169(-)
MLASAAPEPRANISSARRSGLSEHHKTSDLPQQRQEMWLASPTSTLQACLSIEKIHEARPSSTEIRGLPLQLLQEIVEDCCHQNSAHLQQRCTASHMPT